MIRLATSVLAATVVTASGCPKAPALPPATATPASSEQDVDTTFESILDQALQRSPTWATALGDHRYDDRWPGLDPEMRTAQRQWVTHTLTRLAELPRDQLDPDQRVDLDILTAEIELERFNHEVTEPWLHSPLYYARIIGAGLDDLVSREFAPVDVRAASVAARLEALPRFVDQAIANLKSGRPQEPHTRVAIGQLEGVEVLISTELPTRLAKASNRARVEAAAPAALAAVEKLHAVIRDELLPKANGEWRLGREAFARKLALTLQTELSADEVRARAEREHTHVRQRMAALARELFVPLFGAGALARLEQRKSPDLDDRIITRVLDELADDHVVGEHLRDAAEQNLQRLDAFVRERAIVPLDGAEVLEVIWTPPHQRGVAIAGLAAPGALEGDKKGLPSFYLVQPIPDDWTAKRGESFLREYNNFMLEILSIHEAIPGHFVQLYYAKREPSMVRKVFQNGPFVEGWAVYMEQVMVERGYSGIGPADGAQRPRKISKGLWRVKRSPELRAKAIALQGAKFYLRTVTNAILDNAIHAGSMTRDQAIALMTERSFQQEGEAAAKWIRAQVSSTQLSTYFVGAQAWFAVREQAEKRAREDKQSFDMAKFHAEALGHGAPPVHRLVDLMGW